MMVFNSKINNYMFRLKSAIFRLPQLQFCSKIVIYTLHSDVEISSSYYALQVSLSSGMSSESMNGGVWISLLGCVLGGRDIGVVSMVLTLGWGAGWVCGVSLSKIVIVIT